MLEGSGMPAGIMPPRRPNMPPSEPMPPFWRHLLHHVRHLAVHLEQLVDVLDLGAGAIGDALLAAWRSAGRDCGARPPSSN
jgi:hypothetical protein